MSQSKHDEYEQEKAREALEDAVAHALDVGMTKMAILGSVEYIIDTAGDPEA